MAGHQLAVAPDAPPAAVPMSSMLFLVSSFIGNTTGFLNDFAHTAERKLAKASSDISKLEKSLILLEAKLARIPGLTDLPEEEVSAPASTRTSSAAATEAQAAGNESGSGQGTASAEQDAPATSTAAQSEPAKPEVPAEYKKYERLLQMGMPAEQVAMKMQSEGADPKLLGIGGDSAAPAAAPAAAAPAPASAPAAVPEGYERYQKLLKMGMPAEQVAMKMQSEGADPKLLGIGGDSAAPAAAPAAAAPAPASAPAAVPEGYERYQKLLKMGMPAEQVAMKMQSEGADPKLLGI